MENPDLMFCQLKAIHFLDSKCSMKACSPPHHTPVGLQFLLSITWGGQWLWTWIICKKRKEDTGLLAAFSSVTGLDTELPCDSEGLHGSHTAGLCLAMQQNRQASACHVPGLHISRGTDTKFWLGHTWCHPTRRRLEQSSLCKRLHCPSWMQEQAMLVYVVNDTPAFLFLQTCLPSSGLVSSNCH